MVKVVKIGDDYDYQYNTLENRIIDVVDELYGLRDYYINPSHLINFDYIPDKGQLKMNIEVGDKKFILSSLITGVNNQLSLNKVLPVIISSYLSFIRNIDPVFRSKIGLPKQLTEADVEEVLNSSMKTITHYFVNRISKTGSLLFSINDKQVCSVSADKSIINIIFIPNTIRYYVKPKRITIFWVFIAPALLPLVKLLGYNKGIVLDVYDAYYRRFYLSEEEGSCGVCRFEKKDDGSTAIECVNF